MRISDWSSDVCSSDLRLPRVRGPRLPVARSRGAPPFHFPLPEVEGALPMKAPLQAVALIVLTAAATTAVVLPVATATAQQSTVSSAPTPVAGLPDFSRLVEQVGPRSEERRAGKECASTCRSRRSPYH